MRRKFFPSSSAGHSGRSGFFICKNDSDYKFPVIANDARLTDLTRFGIDHVDTGCIVAAESWFEITGPDDCPDDPAQKAWTAPVYDKAIQKLTPKFVGYVVNRFNYFQDKFASQWLNMITCKKFNVEAYHPELLCYRLKRWFQTLPWTSMCLWQKGWSKWPSWVDLC